MNEPAAPKTCFIHPATPRPTSPLQRASVVLLPSANHPKNVAASTVPTTASTLSSGR